MPFASKIVAEVQDEKTGQVRGFPEYLKKKSHERVDIPDGDPDSRELRTGRFRAPAGKSCVDVVVIGKEGVGKSRKIFTIRG